MGKIKFEDFLKFNKSNVKERLRKLPSAMFYFGQQELELEKEVSRLETRLSVVKATIGSQIRQKYERKKSLTETRVKDLVSSHPEVEALIEELDSKRDTLKLSKLRMKVLYAMSESMTQYGHYIRQERQTKINHNL